MNERVRCTNCRGWCNWTDDAWVCTKCGDEWYPEHGDQFAVPCAGRCDAVLRESSRDVGLDAHFTTVPPIVPSAYEPLAMQCPHGVLWYGEPTGEQITQWVRDGVL